MKKSKGRFNRPIETRPYRKTFHLFGEGRQTERLYFRKLEDRYRLINISYNFHTKNSPRQILQRVKEFIKEEFLKNEDEIWLVIDIDSREKCEFEDLLRWENEEKNYRVALSNPHFEYWLLLHFDKGDDILNAKDCESRLKKHLPNYRKNNLDEKIFLKISTAITNAKNKHSQCKNWHLDSHTTVYQLVERIQLNCYE